MTLIQYALNAYVDQPSFAKKSEEFKAKRALYQQINTSPLLKKIIWQANFETFFTVKRQGGSFSRPARPYHLEPLSLTKREAKAWNRGSTENFILFKAYESMQNSKNLGLNCSFNTEPDLVTQFVLHVQSPAFRDDHSKESIRINQAMSLYGHVHRVLTSSTSNANFIFTGFSVATVVVNLILNTLYLGRDLQTSDDFKRFNIIAGIMTSCLIAIYSIVLKELSLNALTAYKDRRDQGLQVSRRTIDCLLMMGTPILICAALSAYGFYHSFLEPDPMILEVWGKDIICSLSFGLMSLIGSCMMMSELSKELNDRTVQVVKRPKVKK